mmetsp:Transcript_12937/g.30807  ORF Transcript_12937/g.30807 Transcript_12937/m.30807 type:complete len:645 (-) Transcript_12937:58-1992(-)
MPHSDRQEGLNGIVRERLLQMFREVEAESGWKVLVVDRNSVRFLSAACKMSEVTEEGVTLVENLELKRQPMASMDAIYFISPTVESVKRMCEDWSGKNRMYAAAHIYFTSHIDDTPLFSIKQCMGLVAKIRAIKELNLEFIASESQAFSLDMPEAFQNLYGPSSDVDLQAETISAVARRLATLFVTLGVRPTIRYQEPASAYQDAAERLAKDLELQLEELEGQAGAAGHSLWWRWQTHPPPTLLILDRARDMISPLIHEYSYQAMANDLLPVKNGRYSHVYTNAHGDQQKQEVLLDEGDPLWPTLRHLHISDAINLILDEFNAFVKDNKTASMVKGEAESIKDMSEAIQQMPQYKELLSKYSLHMDITHRCLDVYNEQNVEPISALEQDVATGKDADRNKVKTAEATLRLEELLMQESEKFSVSDKLRMLIIFVAAKGEKLPPGEVERLLEVAKLQHYSRTMQNLEHVRVPHKSDHEEKAARSSFLSFLKGKSFKKKREPEVSFELARFRTPAQFTMEDCMQGKLSDKDFPYLVPPGNAKAAAKTLHAGDVPLATGMSVRTKPRGEAGKAKEQEKETQISSSSPPMVVFVIGGMAYNEICAAYTVSKGFNKHIYIGSTDILAPNDFLAAIGNLHDVTASMRKVS